MDILSYTLHLEFRDGNDTLSALERVNYVKLMGCDTLELDLYQADNEGAGMQIDADFGVQQFGEPIPYIQKDNKLYFMPFDRDTATITFKYSGIPKTGLIIGNNKFGERTYFGDNWPDRAHHWFACIDHPSDKAQIRFEVKAPKRYHVVASGLSIQPEEGTNIAQEAGYTTHFFQTEFELPTKVMVIGLAEFVYHEIDHPIAQRNYVYQKDSAAISDLDVAASILDYYVNLIGPYPFEKLYHIQSTTQFGGMENAGNIFYDENAFTGENKIEALIAHEIVHQWFGNSVSEADWCHLWLSEGFATYLTDLYIGDKYGKMAMNQRLINERERVLNFYKKQKTPLVDSTQDLFSLLNPNSYQKGAWVLHMLQEEIGKDCFVDGIRVYNNQFNYSNAESRDFFDIMEITSGIDLSKFENQWLNQIGHPELNFSLNGKGSDYTLKIQQKQPNLFHFPIEIGLSYTDRNGTDQFDFRTYYINQKSMEFPLDLPAKSKLIAIQIDPNVRLLFEGIANIPIK